MGIKYPNQIATIKRNKKVLGIDAKLVSKKYNIPLAELFAGKTIDVSDYTVRCQLAKWWQSEERCPGVITCNELFDEVRQIF